MTVDAILARFDELNTWRQGGERAPHKPLLVLYALGRWQQGKPERTYAEVEPALTALLPEFVPAARKSDHPEQPFGHLQRNGAWTVTAPGGMAMKTGDEILCVTAMRSADVRAGFSQDVRAALAKPTPLRSGSPLSAEPVQRGQGAWVTNNWLRLHKEVP